MNRSAFACGVVFCSIIGCGGLVVVDDAGSGGSGSGGNGSGGFGVTTNGVTNGVTTNVSVGITNGVTTGGFDSPVCVTPAQSDSCSNCLNGRLEQGFCNDQLEELVNSPNFQNFIDCTDSCGGDGPACCNGCLSQTPEVESPYRQALSCLTCNQGCFEVCRPLSDALCALR